MKFEIISVPRRPPWPLWALGIVLFWAGLGIAAVYLSHYYNHPVQLCLLRNLTGVPCPTCGFTRGTLALFEGHFIRAWLYNPLLFSLLGIYGFFLAFRIFFTRSVRFRLDPPERSLAWILAAALILANWAYVISYDI